MKLPQQISPAALPAPLSASDTEWVSALMDGESAASPAQWQALLAPGQPRQSWALYQLTGDVLRSAELATPSGSQFSAKVMAALADEPVVLAPRRLTAAGGKRRLKRWLMPTVAVAAAVAAVVWVALPQLGDTKLLASNGPVRVAPNQTVPAAASLLPAVVPVANQPALDLRAVSGRPRD